LTIEAFTIGSAAQRRTSLEVKNNNKCGKPIIGGRNGRTYERSKRKIEKLEAVIQSGTSTREGRRMPWIN
jgi:hypothetical protein